MLDSHFVMEQATRYRAGWLFQFNGTGGLWRRAAVDRRPAAGRRIRSARISTSPCAPSLPDWHGIFSDGAARAGSRARARASLARSAEPLVERLRPGRAQADAAKSGRPIGRSVAKMSASASSSSRPSIPVLRSPAVSFLICLLLRGLNPLAYLPLIEFLLRPDRIGGSGHDARALYHFAARLSSAISSMTLASVPPLMVYVSVSNAPAILKTFFGRREQFKRTPKAPRPRSLTTRRIGAESRRVAPDWQRCDRRANRACSADQR